MHPPEAEEARDRTTVEQRMLELQEEKQKISDAALEVLRVLCLGTLALVVGIVFIVSHFLFVLLVTTRSLFHVELLAVMWALLWETYGLNAQLVLVKMGDGSVNGYSTAWLIVVVIRRLP